MHPLDLFGYLLHPQYQHLPTNQAIIIIIMASIPQQHVFKGPPDHRYDLHAFQHDQSFTHPHQCCYPPSSEVHVDIPIQVNQFGEQNSAGKPAGNIKQKGLPKPSQFISLTIWDNIVKSLQCRHALVYPHSHG